MWDFGHALGESEFVLGNKGFDEYPIVVAEVTHVVIF
jgi:hypothetical protein